MLFEPAGRGGGNVLTYRGGDRHGAGDQLIAGGVVGGHHAELAGGDELGQGFDLLLQRGGRLVLVRLRVGVGGLVAGVCVGEGRRHV